MTCGQMEPVGRSWEILRSKDQFKLPPVSEWNLNLVAELPQGFALHELICDESGKPVDYRFLYLNKAFERMTGLESAKVLGKTVLEVLPQTEKFWIDRYGQVALTGVPQRFEEYSAELDQYYSVYAFSPELGNFAVFVENTTSRHQAMEPFHEEKSLHLSLFETQQTVMLIVDPEDGRIIDANPAAANYYGWSRQELREMKIEQINDLSQAEIRQEMEQARLEQRSHFYFCHRLANGQVRNVHVYSTPIVWENKTYLCSMVYDISERKQLDGLIEQLLVESRQRTREMEGLLAVARMVLQESEFAANAGIVVKHAMKLTASACGCMELVDNQSGETNEIFIANEPCCGKQRLLSGDVRAMRQQVINTGKAVFLNQMGNRQNRSFAVVNSTENNPNNALAAPLIIEGSVVGLLALAGKASDYVQQDLELVEVLTELASMALLHSRTLEELRENESRYRAVISQASEAIVLIDLDSGWVVEGNEKFADTFGYVLNGYQSLHITKLAVDEPDKIWELLRKAEQEGGLPPERRMLRHRNGSEIPVFRSGRVVQYRGRKLFVATLRDISAEIRREQEILRDAAAARKIQTALLTPLSSNEYLEMAFIYHPHLYVGGDLYFLDWRRSGTLLRGFLIDAMGHGLGTALHAAAIHVILREINELDLPLVEQVQMLNVRTARHFSEDTLAAAIAFEIDLKQRELRWVTAGISDIWVGKKESQVVVSHPGSFLGVDENGSYEEQCLPLEEGDILCFCSDGLSDLLRQKELPLRDWDKLNALLVQAAHSTECRDDATAVCVRVLSFPNE